MEAKLIVIAFLDQLIIVKETIESWLPKFEDIFIDSSHSSNSIVTVCRKSSKKNLGIWFHDNFCL